MEEGTKTILGELQNWLEDYVPAHLLENCAGSLNALIKQQRQAYADVIIGEDIRMNFKVEDPNFEEKRRLEDALNKQKQVQRTRNENGGKV